MPDGNNGNLRSNRERSEQNVKEISSKGGKASGEARRKKKERREIFRDVLEGRYTDKKTGESVTGEELLIRGIALNLSDPKSRNWLGTVKLIAEATGMTMTADAKNKLTAEVKKIKAETELTKAKTQILAGDKDREASPIDLITEEIFRVQTAMRDEGDEI